MTLRTYLLSNVFRSPDDAAGAPAPAAAGDPAAAASSSAAAAAASPAAAAISGDGAAAKAADAPAAPADGAAAEGAAASEAKPESTPSLLEAAEAKLPAKEGDKPADAAAAPKDGAKADVSADGAKPATDAKPDKDAKPAEKPADKKADKPVEGAAPAEEALAAKPQARSYEAFKVPEGAKLDDKQVKSFTDVLEAADLGHQDRAQKLVDLHVAEMQRVVQEQVVHQRKVWTDYTDQLKADYKKDPELGGNRADTTLGISKYVVEQFGGTEEQQKDLLAMMTHTGIGNYVGLSRLLNNIYERAVAPRIVPGTPPSRGGSRKTFQDVAYGDPGASGAAS